MSNNWHRIVWQLSQPNPANDPLNFFLNNFFAQGKSNKFSLEPVAYTGPQVTIGQGAMSGTFEPNSLCFLIRFDGAEMSDPWKACLLFPIGTQPLQLANNKPVFAAATERLQGMTRANNHNAVVVVGMDTTQNPTVLHIAAADVGQGGHLGMGVAHQ